MPQWMALPPGHTPTDVSVTLNLYSTPVGNDAKVILKDRNGKKVTAVKGRMKGCPFKGYPSYDALAVSGTTEIVEFRRMEPIFYVNDDPAVRRKVLSCKASDP